MARKKKQKHGEEEGGEAWLLPYSDLMTLLLAVFIVLFAVSKIDQTKAEEISNSFKSMMTANQGIISKGGNSFVKPNININPTNNSGQTGNTGNENGVTSGDVSGETAEEDNQVSKEELEKFLGKTELKDMIELKGKLDEMFQEAELEDTISTNIDLRGLVVTLNNAILFDSGSADIKPEYADSLIKIGDMINKVDNHIRVEGHTDNRPIVTAIYPSNWELSAARATRVVRLFISKCNVPPEKVVAVGYGEYKPIASNSTEAGRKKNRRIDIIILSEKYNELEEQTPVNNINN